MDKCKTSFSLVVYSLLFCIQDNQGRRPWDVTAISQSWHGVVVSWHQVNHDLMFDFGVNCPAPHIGSQ